MSMQMCVIFLEGTLKFLTQKTVFSIKINYATMCNIKDQIDFELLTYYQ